MQRNLKWKLLLIASIYLVCIYFFVSPRGQGQPWFSRMPLGLDLKGGIHLVLQVVTDDALNAELAQDAERIAQDLKTRNIPFATARKGPGQTVEIDQVDSSRDKEVRELLTTNFSRKYSVRSSVSPQPASRTSP